MQIMTVLPFFTQPHIIPFPYAVNFYFLLPLWIIRVRAV